MKKISRFIAGTILGSSVSAALVLLFTPKSGPQLRRQLESGLNDFTNEIKMASEYKRRELEDELTRLKSE